MPRRGLALPVATLALSAALCPPLPSPLASQEEPAATRERPARRPPQHHEVNRATSQIEIDGVLDEATWADALSLSLPYQSSPTDGVPAPVETECLITYDTSNLYLACRAFDPDPSRIRARVADRDTPFQDDYVLFLLDTFNDQRRAFMFGINPYGVQMDALLGVGHPDLSWDEIWASSGRITEHGFVVEAAIPFKSLSFPDSENPQTWGIIVERSYPRSVRHQVQNIEQDLSNSCLLCQADKMTGFVGISAGSDLEFDPTITSSRTDRRDSPTAGRLESGSVEVEPGLTARWGITTNLSLDATLNPDFSQVEADVAQLETNRRFALFFPEKRSFFLEGADIFASPANLIFTRTVVDPLAGAKLSGKAGRNALGLFLTRDEVNTLIFPANQESRSTLLENQGVTAAVGRYRRDIGASSSLGALFTGRVADGYHNWVGAVDGNLRLNRSTTLVFQYARSETRYPEAVAAAFGQKTGSFGGDLALSSLQHRSRDWQLSLDLRDLGRGFRGDAGFIPQVDVREGEVQLSRIIRGAPGDIFSQLRFGTGARYGEDHDGRVTDRAVWLGAGYEGPLQSSLEVGFALGDEFWAGRLFGLHAYWLELSLRPSGALALELDGWGGRDVDLANAREADALTVSPAVTWRAGRRVYLRLSHNFERLSTEGERIFDANLSQLRLQYHFSAAAFLRAIVQYRNVARNPELFSSPVEETTEMLFTQLLFSFELNPRTVAFVGYSGDRLGLTDTSLTQTNRTFFLKLGYAWRP